MNRTKPTPGGTEVVNVLRWIAAVRKASKQSAVIMAASFPGVSWIFEPTPTTST